MAGRITASEEQLKPDPKFGDLVLARFINCMMLGGNKATATRIVYSAFDEIQKRLDDGKAPDLPENA
ncbi:MAG: 30S ribosomal protein S7, partial [Planctomycetota bacterium]|nr:30S ribosomal protein S7 [Planctomycetota bacterium]